MTVEQMRSRIRDVYPAEKWHRRVYAMYDDQVIAVFHNFAERGMFEKPKGNRKVKQLNLFGLIDNLKENKV